ncbi:ribose-phosphate pyrophosphokinase [Elongatibacter sediminis]|uniref:ribose-phosphate diphosphokinase n=1 Tax=Elongatibacter sediminis TaxID=3119006 RepID=A0AAW9RIZ5_9GAMM
MKPIVFSLPGHETLGAALSKALNAPLGGIAMRSFPDGETYVRGETRCNGNDVVLAVNLFHPNPQLLPLIYATRAVRILDAGRVILVTPYLPYMRQDARFQPGEVITSRIFASLLSETLDGLVTVDPHLHRYTSLEEIYSIPTRVEHAAPSVASWISKNVDRPVIVGPDLESEQWVSEVAQMADAPFIVLSKKRRGDRDVEIAVPPLEPWREHTPVLVDDIISTARTMIETIGHLRQAGYAKPVCVGVHAVFAGDAYESLKDAGASDIVTCNTITHPSNGIDLTHALAHGVNRLLENESSHE